MHAPHDMAVVASPVRLAGKERPLALLVAETWEAGNSRRHKFILLPEGTLLWHERLGQLPFSARAPRGQQTPNPVVVYMSRIICAAKAQLHTNVSGLRRAVCG